ncbi:MAG: ABC transporter permease [Spirochaetes bacterium]|nr:ABC transporter permease [Spirochaetota bacterium]
MELILKIAWRNILRHKGKSLIIGVILFLGSLLMTVGNGVISGMDHGLERNIVNGFLGDLVIIPGKEKSDNVLFKMYGESIDKIANYKDIKKLLQKEDYIAGFLPIGRNVAMILNEEEGDPGYAMLLGVDFDQYRRFFPNNFESVEGRLLAKGESGILIPLKHREDVYDQMNVWLIPEGSAVTDKNLSDDARKNRKYLNVKHDAVFMGMSDVYSSSDIRLPVRGIIRYNALNTIWGHFSIMDIESYRRCLGYFAASESAVKVTKEKKKLLEMDSSNLDAMFGTTDFVVADTGKADISGISFKRKEIPKTSGDVDLEDGAYNLILVRLKDRVSLNRGLSKLNRSLASANLGVRATTWKKASGFIGSMATLIKGALFVFVMFLFLVAIIIIVNTLTMAALERTTEIGMMRAVGAQKGFIGRMFLGETAILSGLFGGLGVLIGVIAVKITPLLRITSDNDLVQLLFGGDTFMPYLSLGDIAVVLFELLLVTFITVIYPVKVSRGITPLDAISRD